jgi:hypothetical protein
MAIPRNLANIAPSVAGNSDGVTGITFAATQSASGDANTLDDYEEGTWTPTITGGSNITSLTGVDGKYVKVGKLVYCEANFTGNITSSSAETNFEFALPFSRNGSQTVGTLSLLIGSGADRFGVGVVSDGGSATSKQGVYIAANQTNASGAIGWMRCSLTYTV